MSYTLDSHALGTVTLETSTKDASLFFMTLPGSDSDSAIAFDLFGAKRTIRIEGTWTTADGTIADFISWLDGLVNGSQSTVTYASDTSSASYSVLVETVSWSRGPGEVTMVTYSISMTQAA